MTRIDTLPTMTPWLIKEEDMPLANARARLLHLVRYAVLAPSTHNTQPWRFEVTDSTIRLFMDQTRWLAVADADQRELHLSTGCALENLLIAAEHYGYACNVKLLPDRRDKDFAAEVTFAEKGTAAERSVYREGLFDFIPLRSTNHHVYDGTPVAQEALRQLQIVCAEPTIRLMLLSDPSSRHRIDDLVARADAVQFADPAFRAELSHWLGQGAFGESWFMSKLSQMAVRLVNLGERAAKHDSQVLMSAPVFGVIVSDPSEGDSASASEAEREQMERRSQIMAGQVYDRVQLMTTRLGLSLQPMNQILQQRYFKSALADILFGERVPVLAFTHSAEEISPVPLMAFRLGRGEPEAHHTPRRDLAEMVL